MKHVSFLSSFVSSFLLATSVFASDLKYDVKEVADTCYFGVEKLVTVPPPEKMKTLYFSVTLVMSKIKKFNPEYDAPVTMAFMYKTNNFPLFVYDPPAKEIHIAFSAYNEPIRLFQTKVSFERSFDTDGNVVSVGYLVIYRNEFTTDEPFVPRLFLMSDAMGIAGAFPEVFGEFEIIEIPQKEKAELAVCLTK